MDNNYAGIKVLLELKRKRLMDKIGLTYSDSVGTDALDIEVKKSRVTQIKETVKRERDNEDSLDNVYKRLKTGGDYNSVDFSFEESDNEGAILNVKFNNTSNSETNKIIQLSDDEEKSIVTEFLSDSKPEPDSKEKDDDTTVFSLASSPSSSSSSSTISKISKEDVENFFKNPRIIYKNEIKEKQTYQIPKSAFDSYIKKKKEINIKQHEELEAKYNELELLQQPIEHVKTRYGRDTTQLKASNMPTSADIDEKITEIKKIEEGINKNMELQYEAKIIQENQTDIDKKQPPIGFFNLKKYLSQTFIGNSGFELINYDDDEDMVKLVEKSIVIADTFSGHDKLEDQLQLFQDLSEEDKNFFTISDSEMDEYFKKIIPEPKDGMINDWKQYLKLFPQARITVPNIEKEESKNVRAFLHYALNTDKYKNLVKLVNLANRVKVLAFLQEFPIQDEAKTVDTESKSGESIVPLEQDYDGYGVEPLVPGEEGYTIVIDDNYWEYMMAVSPLPDGGGKKTKEVKKNKSKKPKSVSQKKGGFLKGILKNFGSCGCDKKGKSKTKRRNGRNVSFKKKKGKKLGGKRTFRKERKNKKRVRFTIKA